MISPSFTRSCLAPICLLLLLSLSNCGHKPANPSEISQISASNFKGSLTNIDTNLTRILIDKSDYQLYLFENDCLLRTYPVVLGLDPVTDKMFEGDGCTPEGKFKVRTKYAHAKWSKFIWVDYQTAESWEKFKTRKAAGMIAQYRTIGGEIGIHGVPECLDSLIDRHINWTLGCISLKRADVDELYGAIRTGTDIEIRP